MIKKSIPYIYTLESQGRSFLNGVKFSVQTISLGSEEYRRLLEFTTPLTMPLGRKLYSGDKLFDRSTKLSDAQSKPANALVKLFQFSSILKE